MIFGLKILLKNDSMGHLPLNNITTDFHML